MLESSLIKLQVLRTAVRGLPLKRDSDKGFFLRILRFFKNTYFVEDLRTAGSETPAAFLRTPLFTKYLQWVLA